MVLLHPRPICLGMIPRTATHALSSHHHRIPHIDALRGLAVLFMLEAHLGFWWLKESEMDHPAVVLGSALGGMAAPIFFVTAGTGLYLSMRKKPAGFLRRSLTRGGLLVATGVVFTVLENHVYGFWGWGVLQCIGLSILICAPLMLLNPTRRALLSLSLLLIAPALRFWAGVPVRLFSDEMSAASSPMEYMRNMFLSGFFPLLPWAPVMMAGSVAGQLLFGHAGSVHRGRVAPGVEWRTNGVAIVVLASLVLTGAGVILVVCASPLEFFPPSLSFSLLSLGIAILALTTATLFPLRQVSPSAPEPQTSLHPPIPAPALSSPRLSSPPSHPPTEELQAAREEIGPQNETLSERPGAVIVQPGPLASLGRLSLTIFVMHHFIGYELFRAAGLLGSMTMPMSVFLICVFCALSLAAALVWSRIDFRWSLEWLLARLSGSGTGAN